MAKTLTLTVGIILLLAATIWAAGAEELPASAIDEHPAVWHIEKVPDEMHHGWLAPDDSGWWYSTWSDSTPDWWQRGIPQSRIAGAGTQVEPPNNRTGQLFPMQVWNPPQIVSCLVTVKSPVDGKEFCALEWQRDGGPHGSIISHVPLHTEP